jgi:flagellar protein FlgJ
MNNKDKAEFVKNYYPQAQAAGLRYGINPQVILAQAAHESGWGSSFSAKTRNNFFGITASGAPNEYWDGANSASLTNPKLKFRIYTSAQDSFFDFARLIAHNYKTAASVSNNTADYAKAIAQSSYISESNGDNRSVYESAIMKNAAFVLDTLASLKKKLPQQA